MALFNYADSGNVSNVMYLLENNADPNVADAYQKTPLHVATYKDSHSVIDALINAGANVNAKDEKGNTPLHEAAMNAANVITLQRLLVNGADVDSVNETGSTPLHYAAINRHGANFASVLFAHKASVTARDSYGNTPLHVALNARGVGINLATLCVLAAPNTVNVANAQGETPLLIAVQNSWVPPEVLQLLVNLGADLHAKFVDNNSLLHFAVENGCVDKTRLLIHLDAQVNVRNARRYTPLATAILSTAPNAVQCAKILLDASADITAVPGAESPTMSLLHLAVLHNNKPMVVCLIKHGADINARDAVGARPLHLAVYRNMPAMVQLLIEHNAAIIVRDDDDNTPLHLAAKKNSMLVEVLLNAVGTVSSTQRKMLLARNKVNETPLDIARRCGDILSAVLLTRWMNSTSFGATAAFKRKRSGVSSDEGTRVCKRKRTA